MIHLKCFHLQTIGVEPGVIKPIIISHLTSLKENFRKDFLLELDNAKLDWIQNPFIVQNQDIEHLPLNSQKEFAEISSDSRLRLEFTQNILRTFWLKAKTEFPTLSDLAVSVLLPFVSKYLCEFAFSIVTCIKIKYRASIRYIEATMRPAQTRIEPRFDLFCKKMQHHPSH